MTFKAQKWRQVVGSSLTNLTAEYTLPCHKRPYSIFFKYKSFRVKKKGQKSMCKKTSQARLLYAPSTCQHNNRCTLTKLKCKQSMQENICLPRSCIDLSALHSQPQAVVSLSLQHKIESRVLLYVHTCRLITNISFSKRGLCRAIDTMSFHSRGSITALHMTWLHSKNQMDCIVHRE